MRKVLEDAAKDLTAITGRKPAISKSRHSIANFKLREGQAIGCRVTLRRAVSICAWLLPLAAGMTMALTALTISVGAVSFSRNPLAPARSAS